MPSQYHLLQFRGEEEANLLYKYQEEIFHYAVSKLLFINTRSQKYIQTEV